MGRSLGDWLVGYLQVLPEVSHGWGAGQEWAVRTNPAASACRLASSLTTGALVLGFPLDGAICHWHLDVTCTKC